MSGGLKWRKSLCVRCQYRPALNDDRDDYDYTVLLMMIAASAAIGETQTLYRASEDDTAVVAAAGCSDCSYC